MSNFSINRRKFLAALGMGTAHLLFTNPLLANSTRFASLDPLQMVKLGNSGLETSLIGVGTGVSAINRSSALTRQEHDKSIATLLHAYDRGFKFYDLADSYGTHPLMKEALKKMDREKLTIGTKIWVGRGGIPGDERPDADIVVDRFRKELDVDYIDLIQIHLQTDPEWTEKQKKQMDILEDLKAKGIIKAHGVSVHSLEAMEAALASDWVDVIHVRINPYGIAMDKPDPKDVVGTIEKLHQSGKGVIGMKLIGAGNYKDDSEKINNTIKFVLGLGTVDMVVIGFENIDQIDNYMDRTEAVLAEMNRT